MAWRFSNPKEEALNPRPCRTNGHPLEASSTYKLSNSLPGDFSTAELYNYVTMQAIHVIAKALVV